MRMSRLLVRTLREAPADAEVASHQLLVRAGYIRRLASGVYTFLPLGLRVLHRVERVIREELDAAGCQELLLPALHPIELWEQSGRAALFGSDALPAMTVEARGGTFVLGPDPRGGGDGHRRGRGRLLPPAAAHRVPDPGQVPRRGPAPVRPAADPRADHGRRLLLRRRQGGHAGAPTGPSSTPTSGSSRGWTSTSPRSRPQSGAIGGDVNHEFMVPSAVGEDHFVRCPSCGYAANVEAATRAAPTAAAAGPTVPRSRPDGRAPHARTGRGSTRWSAFFDDPASTPPTPEVHGRDRRPRAGHVVLVPGDREAQLPSGWRLFEEADFAAHPSLVKGYIGPIGPAGARVRVVADVGVARPGPVDHRGQPDGPPRQRGACSAATSRSTSGARSPRWCRATPARAAGQPVELVRSVEAAHTFQLGHKYSR